MNHPNPEAVQPMACRTCGSLLNRYLDASTGHVRLTHPLRHTGTADHDVDPVPADQIDARYVCDFCSDPHIIYTFHTRPIETIAFTGTETLVQQYGTDWSACITCATYVDNRDLPGLHHRVMNSGLPLDARAEAGLRMMQQAVLDSILPGRTLATIGHWPPTPLPAPTLPKIRDRLARLIRGDDQLPLHLDQPATRNLLAESLDAARLYWIDPEFTDLAHHAAQTLPATPVTTDLVPAPHGLIAWAQPVGPRADITAATWTTTGDGIHLISYRSIGTGLQPPDLQQVREQVGWLLPRHTHLLRGADRIDAGSASSVLVATWLLIAQKLAHTTPAPVDRAIRRAYQRTGRPAPDVRLVHLRSSTTAGPTNPTGHNTGRTSEYRWWVRGHWRNQPYGPGRAQRRLIYIDPHIRGPETAPIKASTTVRILGGRKTPPVTSD